MEHIKSAGKDRLASLESRKNEYSGKEHKRLWTVMSHSLVKDGYIAELGKDAIITFIVIRAYMNKDKISFPSLSLIAQKSGMSVRTIRNNLKILQAYKWISIERVSNPNGQFGNNQYKILQIDLIRGTNDPSFIEKPAA